MKGNGGAVNPKSSLLPNGEKRESKEERREEIFGEYAVNKLTTEIAKNLANNISLEKSSENSIKTYLKTYLKTNFAYLKGWLGGLNDNEREPARTMIKELISYRVIESKVKELTKEEVILSFLLDKVDQYAEIEEIFANEEELFKKIEEIFANEENENSGTEELFANKEELIAKIKEILDKLGAKIREKNDKNVGKRIIINFLNEELQNVRAEKKKRVAELQYMETCKKDEN